MNYRKVEQGQFYATREMAEALLENDKQIAAYVETVTHTVEKLVNALDYQEWDGKCHKFESVTDYILKEIDDLKISARKGNSKRTKVTVCAGNNKIVIRRNPQ